MVVDAAQKGHDRSSSMLEKDFRMQPEKGNGFEFHRFALALKTFPIPRL